MFGTEQQLKKRVKKSKNFFVIAFSDSEKAPRASSKNNSHLAPFCSLCTSQCSYHFVHVKLLKAKIYWLLAVLSIVFTELTNFMDEKEDSVQYRYAYNSRGNLTHVNDAKRLERYSCPGCEGDLIPILGQIKAKHFRHHYDSCSYETYIHKCAKNAFLNTYRRALTENEPITLELNRLVVCDGHKAKLLDDFGFKCEKVTLARYDLVRIFDKAELEKFDNVTGFTPDVLLQDSKSERRCFIEICVTHPCSQEKIASGIPIIEFKIESERDIQMLLDGVYRRIDERISLYNFSPKIQTRDKCSGTCIADNTEISCWTLSESGRLYEKRVALGNIEVDDFSSVNMWLKKLPSDALEANLQLFLQHADPERRYPMCLLCKHGKNWIDGYMECQKRAKKVAYTEARRCADYELI